MPNDPSAAPIHGLLKELGVQPGRDLGLIGFDNHSYASLLGITSVGHRVLLIARLQDFKAAKMSDLNVN